MLNILKLGFSTAMRQWKIVAIVYFIQFCLAATLGLEVLNVFESSIGNSLEINKLIQNYDHTVISDFFKIHGASLSPLLGQLRWLILIYLLFAVFMDAGMLVSASKPNEKNVSIFWQGGAAYFFPFLRIFFVFLGFALIWTVLIFVPFGMNLQAALNYFPNEKYVVWIAIFLIIIYLTGLMVLLLWSVLSRFERLKNEISVFTSLKKGLQLFRKNSRSLITFMGIFLLFQVVLMTTYWTLAGFLGMTSPFLILLMVLIQQGFSYVRILLRQMLYVGIDGITR